MAPSRIPDNPRLTELFAWLAVGFAILSCIAGFVAGGWHAAFGVFGLCCAGVVTGPTLWRRPKD